jgi:hypothetical protein
MAAASQQAEEDGGGQILERMTESWRRRAVPWDFKLQVLSAVSGDREVVQQPENLQAAETTTGWP